MTHHYLNLNHLLYNVISLSRVKFLNYFNLFRIFLLIFDFRIVSLSLWSTYLPGRYSGPVAAQQAQIIGPPPLCPTVQVYSVFTGVGVISQVLNSNLSDSF